MNTISFTVQLLPFVIGALIGYFIVDTITTFSVYGWFVSSKQSVPFLKKWLSTYKINSLANKPTLFVSYTVTTGLNNKRAKVSSRPYISCVKGLKFPSKWYIEDMGTIPVWSAAHRLIQTRQKELYPEWRRKNPKNKLDRFI